MRLAKLFLFVLSGVSIIMTVHRIPLKNLLSAFTSNHYANQIENLFFNMLLSIFLYKICETNDLKVRYFNTSLVRLVWLLPLFLYMIMFSNLIQNLDSLDLPALFSAKVSAYAAETFASALLEELFFRGFVFALFSSFFREKKDEKWLMKAVALSSIVFGLSHVINIWSRDYSLSVHNAFNQMYAAACTGFLYGAVYVKTRSLLIVVVAHAIGNFGAGIAELMDGVSQIQSVASAREKSVFEILFSELLRILIFGLPLLIGYLMLAYNSGKDAKNWESAEVSKEESMKVGL